MSKKEWYVFSAVFGVLVALFVFGIQASLEADRYEKKVFLECVEKTFDAGWCYKLILE